MRILNASEMNEVSGGDWSLGFDFEFVHGEVSGDESVQEIVSSAASVASDAYWGARDAMADFYEWAANGWSFAMACGNP